MNPEIKEEARQAEANFYFTIMSQIARLQPGYGSNGQAELQTFVWLDHAKQTYVYNANKQDFLEFAKGDELIKDFWQLVQATFDADVKPHLTDKKAIKPETILPPATRDALKGIILEVKEAISDLARRGRLLNTTVEKILPSEHQKAMEKNPNRPCTVCAAVCASRAETQMTAGAAPAQ